METQNYRNHSKYHPPTHFFLYPVSLLLTIGSAWITFRETDNRLIWMAMTLAFFMIMVLCVLVRQHYALGNQNRIVRLEMRLRYYQLTQKRFEPIEFQLSFGQIAALRFASDEELPALTERALTEQLSGDVIKQAIVNWMPDHMRV
jgi:hypothetical protein